MGLEHVIATRAASLLHVARALKGQAAFCNVGGPTPDLGDPAPPGYAGLALSLAVVLVKAKCAAASGGVANALAPDSPDAAFLADVCRAVLEFESAQAGGPPALSLPLCLHGTQAPPPPPTLAWSVLLVDPVTDPGAPTPSGRAVTASLCAVLARVYARALPLLPSASPTLRGALTTADAVIKTVILKPLLEELHDLSAGNLRAGLLGGEQ